ncbi:MAG TPA: hypothetical protein VJZ68_06595 [Nitrososphaera sp.]|nr:hypothetical protein [Nitrososphaera sp.]
MYLDSLIKSGLAHEVNNGDKTLYRITPMGASSWHTTPDAGALACRH